MTILALVVGILIGGNFIANQFFGYKSLPVNNQPKINPSPLLINKNDTGSQDPEEDSNKTNNKTTETSTSTSSNKNSSNGHLIQCLGADNKYSFVTKTVCDFVNNFWATHTVTTASNNSSSSNSGGSSSSSNDSGSSSSQGDIIAPTYSSSEIGTVNPTTVVVTFSENISATDYKAGVTIKVNSVAATISTATRQSDHTKVYYVLSSAATNTDTVTWEYAKISGNIVDDSANALENVTARTVTNNIPASQNTTLTAVTSVYMDANSPTSTQSNTSFFSTGQFGGSQTNRGLLLFDLTSLGSNWTVNSATLKLTVSSNFLGTSHTVNIYRLKRKWWKGDSAGGTPPAVTQASWNNYRQDLSSGWTSPGASNTTSDRDAVAIGSFPVTSATSGQLSITLTPSLVQEWVSGTLDQTGGLILIASNESATTLMRWDTYADSTPANRPQLVINYTPVTHTFLDSLIAFYKLSDSSDASSNGHTLTPHNSPTFVSGLIGNASHHVASSTQYFSNNDAALKLGNSDWTIAGWVKLTDKTNFYSLFTNNHNQNGFAVFYHKVDVLDYFVLQFYNGDQNNPLCDSVGYSGGNPSAGSWVFVAIRNDSVRKWCHLFVNGNVPSSAPSHDSGEQYGPYIGTMTASSGDFEIGNGWADSFPLNGDVDEVGVWNRWLSNSEILQLYNSGTGLSYPF